MLPESLHTGHLYLKPGLEGPITLNSAFMTGVPYLPAMMAILIVVRTRKLIDRFKNTGTTSPGTAKTTAELNIRSRSLFKRLVRRRVFVETAPGRFFLDETNLAAYLVKRKMRVTAIVVILVLLILADFYFWHF